MQTYNDAHDTHSRTGIMRARGAAPRFGCDESKSSRSRTDLSAPAN